jgi:hypothetical protein
VAVLPRLYYLIRFSDFGANDAHRVFESYPPYRGVKKPANKVKRRLLLSAGALGREPTGTANGKVSARWVSNH